MPNRHTNVTRDTNVTVTKKSRDVTPMSHTPGRDSRVGARASRTQQRAPVPIPIPLTAPHTLSRTFTPRASAWNAPHDQREREEPTK